MRQLLILTISLIVFIGLSLANAADAPQPKDHPFNKAMPQNLKGKMISLRTAQGKDVQAYLSGPAKAKNAVIVIHEWWGLNDHIKSNADRLADQGYLTLAVDLYNGKTTTQADEAGKLMQAVNQSEADAILQAAINQLKTPERKIATLGWCFGGGQSLRATLLDPSAIAATVIYYGEPVTDAAKLGALEGSVLGVFAKQDQWITPEKVASFEQAMQKAGKTLELHNYDANHAFANPSAPSFNNAAAQDAWEKTLDFLKRNLK